MRVSPSGGVSVKPQRVRLSGINISEHVNLLLSFKDKKEKGIFELFQVQQSSKHMFLFFQILENIIFIYGKYTTYIVYPTISSLIGLLVALIGSVAIGWVLVVMYYKDWIFTSPKWKSKIKETHIPFVESLWLIGTSISYGLGIIAVGENGKCSPAINAALSRMCGCNYTGSDSVLPDDKMIGSFFFPIMYSIILKGLKWEAILISLILDVFSVVYTVKHFGLSISVGTFVFFLLFSMVILFENRRQRISEFLVTQSQQAALDEVERLAEETHAKELRSMIGNVAHDLKTPMTAFVAGLEVQICTLADMRENINSPTELVKNFDQVQETIQTMKDVNSFMLMSINRCIDYTKASNGMVLNPRLETVNFREMLQLPLNCMKSLQNNKITVKLKPVSENIAQFVITDPQWFQENLLCLLSNAVKYSSEGVVTIKASIITKSMLAEDIRSFRKVQPNNKEMLIRIDVEDTGIGISDEKKATLFSPFKQAQRLAGGTGLGLYSLAKRLEALEGSYGVENRRDRKPGTNFWFAIPYRLDDTLETTPPPGLKKENSLGVTITIASSEPATISASTTPAPVTPTPVFIRSPTVRNQVVTKLNILLVDDSASILKMTGRMLTRLGHSVTTAENGAEALKLISNTFIPQQNSQSGPFSSISAELSPKFDIVLMDLQMPVMDGLEATKRLRVLEETTYRTLTAKTTDLNDGGHYIPIVQDIEDQIPLYQDDSEKLHHQLIVGVSACSDDVTTSEAFAAGVDEFIPKPFSMQNFNDIYQSLMLKKQQQQSQFGSKEFGSKG